MYGKDKIKQALMWMYRGRRLCVRAKLDQETVKTVDKIENSLREECKAPALHCVYICL